MNPTTHKSVQRAATRAPLGIPIRLQGDDSMDVLEGVCKNISIGGMFIQIDEARPQGSLLRFELPLDDGASVRGLGEVVWMRPKSAGPGVEAGIGIKFRFLEQQDRQLIFKLVSQYIKERLAKQGEARAQTPPPAVTSPDVVFRPPDPEPEAAATPRAEQPPVAAAPSTEGRLEGFAPPAPQSPAELAAPAMPTGGDSPLAPDPGEHGLSGGWDDDLADDDPEAGDLGAVDPYRPAGDFAQRSRPRRPRGLMVVLALIVLFAVLGFLFRDRLFGPATEDPTSADPSPATVSDPTPTGTAPDATAPDATAPDATNSGADDAASGAADDDPAADGTTTSEPDGATTDGAGGPEPTAAVSPPPPVQPVTPPPPVAQRGYSNILAITWSETGDGGLRVIFEGDGPIPEQRYHYFRLEGDPPREVIQFRGVEKDFEPGSLTVGGPGVEQIRTGFHTKRNRPNELHVVMDMSSRGAKVAEFRSLGFTLEVLVTVESP